MMNQNSPSREFNLPSLDGMRALATLIVFVSHAGAGSVVPGGFGVTIFFFLSGFLITTLMRREFAETGRVDLGSFYLRRIYRILPPLYLVLALIFVVHTFVVRLPGMATVDGMLSLILQYSNYFILWGHGDELLPATGTYWSLAVEEHFYLVFPLLFIWIARRYSGRQAALSFTLLCGAVLLWRCALIYWLGAPGDRTYLATDTRIDSLLFGCIMGVWMNPALDRDPFPSMTSKLMFLGTGLLLLLLSFALRDEGFRATFRYTIQGLGLFPLFWLAVRHPDWLIFRILNTAPARFLGVISYVFYLSHLLWISIVRQTITFQPGLDAVIALVITLAFSYAVYRTVEIPFARLRRRLHARSARNRAAIVQKGQA